MSFFCVDFLSNGIKEFNTTTHRYFQKWFIHISQENVGRVSRLNLAEVR